MRYFETGFKHHEEEHSSHSGGVKGQANHWLLESFHF